jgi:hypothetical protein
MVIPADGFRPGRSFPEQNEAVLAFQPSSKDKRIQNTEANRKRL